MDTSGLDAVGVDVFLGDGSGVEALLLQVDDLLGLLAVLETLNDLVDGVGLEGVGLAVIVPVASQQLFERPTCCSRSP